MTVRARGTGQGPTPTMSGVKSPPPLGVMLGIAVSLLAVMTLAVTVRSRGPPKKAMFSVRKSSFDRRRQRGHIIRLDEHLHTRPPSMVPRARRVKPENIRAPAEQPRSVRYRAEQ